MFYNHLILSGTKMLQLIPVTYAEFYNHLILSGTKIPLRVRGFDFLFYNHLILSGTKIQDAKTPIKLRFTIT